MGMLADVRTDMCVDMFVDRRKDMFVAEWHMDMCADTRLSVQGWAVRVRM